MNNNIQEKYVTLEVAKLLKKYNFDVRLQTWFTDDGEVHYNFSADQTSGWANRNMPEGEYSRPTVSLAIDWIRENFDIHISICVGHNPLNYYPEFQWLKKQKVESHKHNPDIWYNTPHEAGNAGIEYVIKNLL